MRFLLLGGIGYLGGRLAAFLKSQGRQVSITTRAMPSTLPAWVCADRVYHTDLTNPSEIAPALEGADVVIHLAAPDAEAASKNPAAALRFGSEITWNILDALTKSKSGAAFVYMSSFHLYGRNAQGIITEQTPVAPLHPYPLAKLLGEQVVHFFRRTAGAKALCVRLSNAFGAPAGPEITQWSLVFNDLCRQAVTHRVIRLKSSGLQKRNFITIADTVAALDHLAIHPDAWPEDGVIHAGSTLCLGIRDVAEIVAGRTEQVLGFRPEILAPEPAPGERPTELDFSVERLARTGFRWTNEMDKEVDATLRLCASGVGRG